MDRTASLRRRAGAAPLRGALVSLVATLALGGCSGGGAPVPEPFPAPTSSAPTSSAPLGEGRPATAAATPATASPARSGPSPCHPVAGVDARRAATVLPLRPGTVLLLDGEGGLLSAVVVAPPQAQVTSRAGMLCADRPVRLVTSRTRAVSRVRWIERDGVPSLQVVPSPELRGWPGLTDVLVDRLAPDVPEIALPGMVAQLRCHVLLAPGKAAWHLEPDRPDVGDAATIAAACNPGDLRDPDGL